MKISLLWFAATFLTVAVVGVLNRVAGGGCVSVPDDGSGRWLLSRWLPGKALFWIAPIVGLIGYAWSGPLPPVMPPKIWLLLLLLPDAVAYWMVDTLLALSPYRAGIAWMLAYFLWRLLPWGQWFDMGRRPWRPDRNGFETAINSISFGSKRSAMCWRMLLGALPAVIIFAGSSETVPSTFYLILMLGPLLWGAYEVAWRIEPDNGVPLAEFAAGGIWGGFLTIPVWLV